MRSNLSQFIPCIALVAAIALILATACGGNGEEKRAAERALPPAAESGVPTLTPDTPEPPVNETVPGELETAARKLLADELGVDERELRLDGSEGVGWSDASLGCPKEGMVYAQVITPGYKMVFDLEGTSHAVHANSDGSTMLVCVDGN